MIFLSKHALGRGPGLRQSVQDSDANTVEDRTVFVSRIVNLILFAFVSQE